MTGRTAVYLAANPVPIPHPRRVYTLDCVHIRWQRYPTFVSAHRHTGTVVLPQCTFLAQTRLIQDWLRAPFWLISLRHLVGLRHGSGEYRTIFAQCTFEHRGPFPRWSRLQPTLTSLSSFSGRSLSRSPPNAALPCSALETSSSLACSLLLRSGTTITGPRSTAPPRP